MNYRKNQWPYNRTLLVLEHHKIKTGKKGLFTKVLQHGIQYPRGRAVRAPTYLTDLNPDC
jgi:hypothetical protein